jgi:hypothetical protein
MKRLLPILAAVGDFIGSLVLTAVAGFIAALLVGCMASFAEGRWLSIDLWRVFRWCCVVALMIQLAFVALGTRQRP